MILLMILGFGLGAFIGIEIWFRIILPILEPRRRTVAYQAAHIPWPLIAIAIACFAILVFDGFR